MCGIVGYVGSKQIGTRLIEGLKRLEYRGYDSSGLSIIENKQLQHTKRVGRVKTLEASLPENYLKARTGICHTRWATHGDVTEKNAHPHISSDQCFALVHNGVIENYLQIKHYLESKEYTFASDTDSEAIVNLIAYHYEKEPDAPDSNRFLESVRKALLHLEGTFGIAVISKDYPDEMICARRGSPLIIGVGKNEHLIASDVNALTHCTQNVVYLNDNEIVHLTAEDFSISTISKVSVDAVIEKVDWDTSEAEIGDFQHFMEKEIFEQPEVISQVLGFYLNASEEKLTLPALPKSPQIKRILLIGCGTAFYSCLIAKYWFESISGVPTHAELASEFRYRSPVVKKDDLLVFVSQSGETADTIGALRFAKEHTKNILAIVNVEQSSIARESTWVFPTKAGPEIGVASTKAFICQLIILQILNIKLSSDLFKTTSEQRSNLLKGLLELPRLYSEVLSQNENIKKLCKKFSRAHSVFFLGRDVLYPIALEGALKLKEISYIHAEGYASGELKHGPIALIDKNMSVVALNPSTKVYEKTSSNLEEVKARSGKIILLTDKKGKDLSKNLTKSIFQLPTCSDSVVPILYALPLQLIAYYTARYKGTDVDQPRNLAKSVTVE